MTQKFSEASHKRSAEDAVLCRMFQALVAEQQDTTTREQDILSAAGVQSSAHGRAAEGKPPRVAANQNFRCEVCNLGVGTLAMFQRHLETRYHQLRVGPRWTCLLCGIPDLLDASTHAQHVAGLRHRRNVRAAGGAAGQPVVGEPLAVVGGALHFVSPSAAAAATHKGHGVGEQRAVGGGTLQFVSSCAGATSGGVWCGGGAAHKGHGVGAAAAARAHARQ